MIPTRTTAILEGMILPPLKPQRRDWTEEHSGTGTGRNKTKLENGQFPATIRRKKSRDHRDNEPA